MNRAVFLCTLIVKFRSISAIISLASLIFGLPIFFAYIIGSAPGVELMYDALSPMISGPMLPMFLAYYLVSDTVANSKSFSQGEYLSLLFSRPLSRFSYVISKWLAGSIGVSICILLMTLTFELSLKAMGHDIQILEPYAILSIILNSFSFTSLVVLIYSFPSKVGLTLFLIIIYASMIGQTLTSTYTSIDNPFASGFYGTLNWIFEFLRSFVFPSIDIYELTNSIKPQWSQVFTYFSDMVAYLLLATLVLNQREFFYATE